ncbi:MAG: DNA mismatch repair protein MutS [Bacteroidetes bacterium ADurb.Bin416]|nr:MAG: DNA mismatch repair protein MutS [Bacteroidetes bacterium ADurb.Bin416]
MPQPVIIRANEILRQLESSSSTGIEIREDRLQQMAFFPETNPLLEELKNLDLNTLSPIEALNRLYEWQRQYVHKKDA